MSERPPIVLCLSGHDPLGGAGIHADIEAVAAGGGHALTVITALTEQDSRNVRRVHPVPAATLDAQMRLLEGDCDIRAIKIGMLGEPGQVAVIAAAIERLRVPVVFDPVLRAGGGADLAAGGLVDAVLAGLLPHVLLLTPNAAEARRLTPGAAELAASAQALLARGAANVLVTGGDEPGAVVVNTWYRRGGGARRYEWPRLPETFHGAGCTLASAIAVRLAAGDDLERALEGAQRWTQAALARAVAVGRGRRIPGRLS